MAVSIAAAFTNILSWCMIPELSRLLNIVAHKQTTEGCRNMSSPVHTVAVVECNGSDVANQALLAAQYVSAIKLQRRDSGVLVCSEHTAERGGRSVLVTSTLDAAAVDAIVLCARASELSSPDRVHDLVKRYPSVPLAIAVHDAPEAEELQLQVRCCTNMDSVRQGMSHMSELTIP